MLVFTTQQEKNQIMSILSKLANAQGRKDEEPNKELARELVEQNDIANIQVVAENLWNEDRRVQTDCLSVMEQIGLIEPGLIETYASDFIKLLSSKDNRLVWAAMINLALVAEKKPQEIYEHFDDIVKVIGKGSVITRDNGIKTLAKVASMSAEHNQNIMPYLMEKLSTCRSKSVPQYAESIRVAVNANTQEQFLNILNQRFDELSAAQQKRAKKVLRSF